MPHDQIQQALHTVETKIHTIFGGDTPAWAREIASHALFSQGKRLRARLMILFGALMGAPTEETHSLACVVELLHAASLLHDDVLDDASHRRGRVCAHQLWGNKTAILMGDFVYVKALALADTLRRPDISSVLMNAVTRLVEGELAQHQHARNPDISDEDYHRILRQKTGALFSAALESIRLLTPERAPSWIASWGEDFGLLYQLVDDVLDISDTQESTGKNAYQDIQQGLMTLASIRLRDALPMAELASFKAMIRHPEHADIPRYVGWLKAYNIRAQLSDELRERYTQLHTQLCHAMPPSPERDALTTLTTQVIHPLNTV